MTPRPKTAHRHILFVVLMSLYTFINPTTPPSSPSTLLLWRPAIAQHSSGPPHRVPLCRGAGRERTVQPLTTRCCWTHLRRPQTAVQPFTHKRTHLASFFLHFLPGSIVIIRRRTGRRWDWRKGRERTEGAIYIKYLRCQGEDLQRVLLLTLSRSWKHGKSPKSPQRNWTACKWTQ